MAIPVKNYLIRKNRLLRACTEGFVLSEDGSLLSIPDKPRHTLFLGRIDSMENDTYWGRLSLEAELEEDAVLIIRAIASNEQEFLENGRITGIDAFLLDTEVDIIKKENFFVWRNAIKQVNHKDVLLYGQSGRYLWIYLEVIGASSGFIRNIRVNIPGDNFMNTFPEIYQDKGGFFHRYLSIFSSVYMDFQEKIENIHTCLDMDTAPAELLPVFGKWLGLELDGNFLEEEIVRKLLKNLYGLNRIKGTKTGLERLMEILIGDSVIVIERNIIQSYINMEEKEVYEKLYGRSPYDITILLNRTADESLRSRLLYLIQQFKPLRSQVNIVFLGECKSMDSYCFLDMNARMHSVSLGRLDEMQLIDGSIILQ